MSPDRHHPDTCPGLIVTDTRYTTCPCGSRGLSATPSELEPVDIPGVDDWRNDHEEETDDD